MNESFPKSTNPEGTGDHIGEGEVKIYAVRRHSSMEQDRSEEAWDNLAAFEKIASENGFDIYLSSSGRLGDALIMGDVRGGEMATTRLWNNGPSAIVENDSGKLFNAWVADNKIHIEKM